RMVRKAPTISKRPRITLDVDPDLRRRIRVAAARRDVSVGQWCLEALIERLEEEEDAFEGLVALEDYRQHGGISWEEYKRLREDREA
ncbi:MAG TPA: hypothetical protein VNL15_04255, partial [Dehalococcoidia bacterium]|nr:hypothetical protein [Dehalococcoidia bacterium]